MKDSGIEWIGMIPEGWGISRMKYLVDFEPECDFSKISSESSITYTPMEYIKNGYYIPNNALFGTISSSLTHYQENDIVMAKVTPCFENGNIAIMNNLTSGVGVGSSELFVFRAKEINRCFLFYWLQNAKFIERAKSSMTGTGGLKRVSPQFVKNCEIHNPPLPEQHRIAAYLDATCAQIDAVLEKTRASIEEYKKLKQAIITQAVTKGIRPGHKMKDSGIEWIGEIPEKWEVTRLKNICEIVDCKNRTPDNISDGEYTVVRTTCIRDGSFSYVGSYQTDHNNFIGWTLKGQPRRGDIFFTREAPVGEACLVPDSDKLCMGQRVMYFRPDNNNDSRFIMYSIYGKIVRQYIELKNIGSTVAHLKLGQVADIPILTPTLSEQIEIANHLDTKCAEIDTLIAKKQQLLAELESYKKSLIFEYVTGKKEVI